VLNLILFIIITQSITGDALLTSLHVAKQVGICDTDRPSLTLIGKEKNEVSLVHAVNSKAQAKTGTYLLLY
jgi:magnesium-transporting ATPase (P-type)